MNNDNFFTDLKDIEVKFMENEELKSKGQLELRSSISPSSFLQFFIPSVLGIILFVILIKDKRRSIP